VPHHDRQGVGCGNVTYKTGRVSSGSENTRGFETFLHLEGEFLTPGGNLSPLSAEAELRWSLDELDPVSAGFCLAKPGEEFVTFARDASPFTLDLASVDPTTSLIAEWYDPRLGVYTVLEPVDGGGAPTFTPPTGEGWVLHVGGAPGMLSQPDAGAPTTTRVSLRPNPARGADVTLALFLAGADQVQGRLFAADGREVARQSFGHLRAGRHELAIDTAGLAPGVYFQRIETTRTSSPPPVKLVVR